MRITLAILAALAVPPAPTRWVEDHAQLVSEPARAALDAKLEAYQHATGHQVIVWIGKTIDGQPLDDWAVKTFAAWKLGRKGVDDGIALFVLADDRKIDIEVGYGLEDRVTDAAASRIIREVMTPKLRAGDADGAVTAGADAILTAIEGKPWQPQGVAPQVKQPGEEASWPQIIFGVLGALALVYILVRHPRLAFWILASSMWNRRDGGGGFGGSGGGGGFSGGGGRSGGGGARGGW